jgi:mannose-6-phosphate isomerase-like protein (cupin superfamily)
MSLASRLGLGAAALAAAYLALGHLWHRVVAPLPAPDPATFPRAGDRFGSRPEGFAQEIHAVRDGWVVGTLTLAPGAKGPPLHVHDGFAETFTPTRGTLHVELGDRVVQVRAGDTLRVPPGVAHRPFNPTDTEVVVTSAGPSLPQTFAAALVQLYRVTEERGADPLTMLLQMSLVDPTMFDTHLAGLPRPVERALAVALAPAARLAGFRNYYPEYALHPPARVAARE